MPSLIERVEKTVFLSYRRTNVSWALAIYQNLTHKGYDVFFDYTSIASGDFESVILGNIVSRAHFLVLLTPSALERCQEPGDWLRREIETAIDSKRNVVPLMFEEFTFGMPQIVRQLTGTLEALKSCNGLRITADYFFEGMDRLSQRFLNVALSTVPQPASEVAMHAATEQKTAADAAPVVQEDELTAMQWFERGIKSSDFADKEQLFDQTIRLNPNFSYAFYFRSDVRSERGNYEGALEDANQAIRLDPDRGSYFTHRALLFFNHDEIRDSINDSTIAIHLTPDKRINYVLRGAAKATMGDIVGAIEDYNEAIRLDSTDIGTLRTRGMLYEKIDNLSAALDDFNELIRLHPTNADGFFNRGRLRRLTGDVENAILDYEEAARLDPSFFGEDS